MSNINELKNLKKLSIKDSELTMPENNFSGLIFYGKNGFQVSKTETQLISENIYRILNTRKGERINNPSFGSNFKDYLFMGELEIEDLIEEMKSSIERWEPRVEVKSCSFTSFEDDVLSIDLKVKILSSNELADLNLEVNV